MRTFVQKPKVNQQTTSAKSAKPGRPFFRQSWEVHSILHLQRMIGNQAIQRQLKINAEAYNTELTNTVSSHFRHNFNGNLLTPTAAGAIQMKPAINEQDADRIAEQVMRAPNASEASGLTPASALQAKTMVQCAPGTPRRTPAIQQGLLSRALKTPLHTLQLWKFLNRPTKNKILWFLMAKCGFGFTQYFHVYARRGGRSVNTLSYSNYPYYTPQYLRKKGYCKWGSFALARNVFSETWFHYTGREFRTTRWGQRKPSLPPPKITPTKSIIVPKNPVQKYGRVIRRNLTVSNPLGPGQGEAVLYQSGVIEVILNQRPRRAMTFIPIPGNAGKYYGYNSRGDRVADPLEDVPAVYRWDSNKLIFLED